MLTPENISKLRNEAHEREEKAKKQLKGYGKGCLYLVGIFIVIGIISSLFPSGSCSSSTSKPRTVVTNSALDSSVYQVKYWLEANAKDPSSIEYIEWSAVKKTSSGEFMVRVKYRAKNSLGGYVVENKVFTLDSTGKVTSQIDY